MQSKESTSLAGTGTVGCAPLVPKFATLASSLDYMLFSKWTTWVLTLSCNWSQTNYEISIVINI